MHYVLKNCPFCDKGVSISDVEAFESRGRSIFIDCCVRMEGVDYGDRQSKLTRDECYQRLADEWNTRPVMTLRDHFAAHCPLVLENAEESMYGQENVTWEQLLKRLAELRFAYADAMMKARGHNGA